MWVVSPSQNRTHAVKHKALEHLTGPRIVQTLCAYSTVSVTDSTASKSCCADLDVLTEPTEPIAIALSANDRAHEHFHRPHTAVSVVSSVLAGCDVVQTQ